MSIARLARAVVAVRDLPAAAAQYAALLGCDPGWQGRAPGRGAEGARFELDNGALELLAPAGPGALGDRLRARLTAEGEGLCAMSLGCDDLDATRRALASQGIHAGVPGDEEWLVDGAALPWRRRTATLSPEDVGGLWIDLEAARGGGGGAPRGAALTAVGPAEAHAIDHLVITTADPEGAIRRYQGGLGLRLALDRTFEERGLRLIFFRFGGVTLELSTLLAAVPEAGVGDRFHGLAYRVQDASAARARLAGAGLDCSALRSGHKPGTRVFTVRGGTHGVPTLILEDPSRARPVGARGAPGRARGP